MTITDHSAASFRHLKYRDDLSKKEKLARLLWEIAWQVLFRPTPRWALHGWRRGLLRLFGAKIGEGSLVAPSCFVWAPWKLTMGAYSILGDGVDCYTMAPVVIGSKVAVSQRAFLCTGTHDIRSLLRPLVTKRIVIGDHAWICSQAFVGPGVAIGEGAVIAACACVVKDVKAWDIVGGNPAVFIKKRELAKSGQ